MRGTVAILAGMLLTAGPALAQMDSREAIALQNQILELRQQMQVMAQQRGGGGGSPPPYRGGGSGSGDPGLTAQLLDRVSTLEDQVRELRGQVDRLSNSQQRMAEDTTKQIGDLKFAMGNAAPAAAAPSRNTPASPPPTSLGGGDAGPAPRTPETAMQDANAALARRDYPAAEAAAREVISKRSARSNDALFVLAQAEMGQRNYQQAAPDFYDSYNRAKTGPRAPDALLGVATALVGLGDKQSACDALAKLRTEFPSPRPDIREGASTVRARAGCR